MHSSKPFAFAAQVSARLIIRILILALVPAASDATALSEPLRCEWPASPCLLSATTDSPAAPPLPCLNCPWIHAPSSTTTEKPSIKDHHQRAALCGLGRCATMHSSKPFAFAAQVSARLTIRILILALVPAASDATALSEPLRCEWPASPCLLSATTDSPAAPPLPCLNCPWIHAPSSTTTEKPSIKDHHQRAALCGLGRCATMHSSKPFAFAAQVSARLIIRILILALVPAASDATALSEPLRCEWPASPCLLSATTDSPAAPPLPCLNCPWIHAPSSTTTEKPSIKDHHQRAALCGLGRCATMHSSKPFAFAAQVSARLIIRILILALVPAASDATALSEPLRCEWPASPCLLSATTDSPAAPPLPCLNCPWIHAPSSTTTEEPSIKDHHQRAALCGLVAVSNQYCLFTKKSSNYCLLQLPSPQCCLSIVAECYDVVRTLLLLAGDIESNPGPDTVLAELKKLSTGQSQLLAEVQGLRNQLTTTEQAISDLSNRLSNLETRYQDLVTLRTDMDAISTNTTQTAKDIKGIEARLDDAENRSRRNNLIFYNITDNNASENYAQSEETVLRLCRDHLGLTIDPKEIERAHRLGRHSSGRSRPIIVKLTFFKTKQLILSNGRKLKGTDYSVGEDFSRPVRDARKHLVRFAKTKNTKFSLRYKTLFIGPKQYAFDESSQTVKEIS
ncbi:uncharacterized protein LOC142564435 [Dermacentor variabilis]|uniref:uncharacterized protein LOC142564435 n=1 Tax=Dermacentor variabilis TaxID=34621 RepID=UPI003F5BBC0C